jgi:hypothetical protein
LQGRIWSGSGSGVQAGQWVWRWRRGGSSGISGGHGHAVDHAAGVEVALEGVRVDEAGRLVHGNATGAFASGASVTILKYFFFVFFSEFQFKL